METKLNKKIINILISFSACLSALCIVWIQMPYNRAVLLWKKGNHEKAISIWNNEISKKNDINSYQKLIEVLINTGNFQKAEALTQRALSYYPDCIDFLFYSALINFYRGNITASLVLTEKVTAINQYFPEVYLLRGLIFEKLNNLKMAKQEFIKELNNNPGNRLAWAKLKESKYANIH
ncbi:MAG: hypothetical protein NC830_01315 [Candidatus Omnitrophica bacterium]|nr:hypothetical protein [Candidatus Omnitrophota bacterium]